MLDPHLMLEAELDPMAAPPTDLPTEDDEKMESAWHRAAMNLLIEALTHYWRGRTDFYVGGNMFLYFMLEQVAKTQYRGPHFFVVLDVDGTRERKAWYTWAEGGRYPDLIVELLSESTASADLTTKKDLYEQVFRTPDYICYNPASQELVWWTMVADQYEPLAPNANGWLWSRQLGLWVGLWTGQYLNLSGVWPRFYDTEGSRVLTRAEAAELEAETERERAEEERERAQRAEAELAALRARLTALGIDPNTLNGPR
jgi:Uma2 family endonuclease